MDFFDSTTALPQLAHFCSILDFRERKALVTLARSQSIPLKETSPILFDKVAPILDKLALHPPFYSLEQALTHDGQLILYLIQNPLFSGMVLVFCLGVELPAPMIQSGYETAFAKELLATQTMRLPSTWNWDAILSPSRHRGEVIHPMFPRLSPLQRRFSDRLPSFISAYRGRKVFPHYTTRGVSSESATDLLRRVRSYPRNYSVIGRVSTFHRSLKPANVTSRDIVHHYMRTGYWARGRTQMKQRWYPSGILPRTYFSWSGMDIACSCYLRNFFNDLGDVFEPTHRKNRVLPSWLRRTSPSHGFLFYDLTSFTSWYHEQVPFLQALARRFRDVDVLLIGPGITLRSHYIGDLIDSYVDWCNNFPEFCIGDGVLSGLWSEPEDSFTHWTAGFLGIPGNLISCTIPHALCLASLQTDIHGLQCPGDDMGAEYIDQDHKYDSMICASTQGKLQFDKVYFTPQLCVYLKRLVLELELSINLSPMLIFPLLPYLINPSAQVSSQQYRLPNREDLFKRTSSVLVSFHRDLWRHTGGQLHSDEMALIHQFLVMVHKTVGLPYQAIFQGCVQGSEEPDNGEYSSVKLKFSIEDPDDLRRNPDRLFSSKYIQVMNVRSVEGIEPTELIERDLRVGERLVVKSGKVWSFLEDMGYVKILGIPGDIVSLVGADARAAFLVARRPSLREVVVVDQLRVPQLIAAGVLSTEGLDLSDLSAEVMDAGRSWTYRRYVDLDNPRLASGVCRSSSWKTDDPYASRDSVSPEPEVDISDLY